MISWQETTGGIASVTVTTDVQVAVLPLASVTVSVTVRAPTSAHVYARVAGELHSLGCFQCVDFEYLSLLPDDNILCVGP